MQINLEKSRKRSAIKVVSKPRLSSGYADHCENKTQSLSSFRYLHTRHSRQTSLSQPIASPSNISTFSSLFETGNSSFKCSVTVAQTMSQPLFVLQSRHTSPSSGTSTRLWIFLTAYTTSRHFLGTCSKCPEFKTKQPFQQ